MFSEKHNFYTVLTKSITTRTLSICIMYTGCTGSSVRSGRNDKDKTHVCMSTFLKGESFSID